MASRMSRRRAGAAAVTTISADAGKSKMNTDTTTTTTTTTTNLSNNNDNQNLLSIRFFHRFQRLDSIFLTSYYHTMFQYLGCNARDSMELRAMCSSFRDAIPPPPLWTVYPSSLSTDLPPPTLEIFFKNLSERWRKNPKRTPVLVLIRRGRFAPDVAGEMEECDGVEDNEGEQQEEGGKREQGEQEERKVDLEEKKMEKTKEKQKRKKKRKDMLVVNYPVTIIGEGIHSTKLACGIKIKGCPLDVISIQHMTLSSFSDSGIYGEYQGGE